MDEQQILPVVSKISINSTSMTNREMINNTIKNKLLLSDVDVDYARYVSSVVSQGTNKILIREDLKSAVIAAKTEINNLNCVFSCDRIEINIKNNNISDIAMLGLEFNLNANAGMTINSSYIEDDYFIGPDYSRPIGDGFMFKIYGLCSRIPNNDLLKNQLIQKEIDIYDIRDTYGITKPKIKKIYKPVIDITNILKKYNFIQKPPNNSFFYKSNVLESNWNVFYNITKIKKGDIYRSLLLNLYQDKKEKIWLKSNLIWNGEKFI